MASRTFAVIGGGVAGLQAAAQLKAAGRAGPLGRQRRRVGRALYLRRVIRRQRQPSRGAQPIEDLLLRHPPHIYMQDMLSQYMRSRETSAACGRATTRASACR
jgi:thioredoxin reductase